MYKRALRGALALLAVVFGVSAEATTFIVPDDAELVEKSAAIITGRVLSARAVEVEPGYIETEYEIAVDRVLKGSIEPRSRMRVSSPGGMLDGRFTRVESAAHFQIDDDVVLFLTPQRGGWTTTDLTLGKFRVAQTSRGNSVAVRDAEDIHGWDRDGRVHKEKIRLEAEFLQFIQEAVAGRKPAIRYEVEAGDVLAEPVAQPANAAPTAAFPATTYSISFYGCTPTDPVGGPATLTRYGGRWTSAEMTAGIPFRKNAAQNASGLADGGVALIQGGLGAWTNDCGSSVNLTYAGTSPNLKNGADKVNVVVFNDPGGHIAGSWGGSGVIATAFMQAGPVETFDGGSFANFTDTDVVFQDGYAGTQATIEEALTHELGHAIGFRHADKHYVQGCTATPQCGLTCGPEPVCDASVQECSGGATAIMTASVGSTSNFALFTWDRNAANALYPGTCVAFSPPTNVIATATSGTSVLVTYNAVAGATQYRIWRASALNTFTQVGTSATTSFPDNTAAINTSYQYVVQAGDGTNFSANSDDDIATTVVFTDPALTSPASTAKLAHFSELLTAVNALRTLTLLAPSSFTAPTPGTNASIARVHVEDLRSAVTTARTALGLTTSFPETLVAGTTTIKASHIIQLRDAVQ